MKYKTSELASLAGISSRTLRYYDEIGLLKPKRDMESNYRYYDESDVDTLQQILFFKEMGFELEKIKKLIKTLNKEKRIEILVKHLDELHIRQRKLDALVRNVQNTIKSLKGELMMSDKEKFEGLKNELIRKNEEDFKDEVITRWGSNAYQESKQQFKNLSEAEFNHFQGLAERIIEVLKEIKANPQNESLKKEVAKLHQQWITIAWGSYDKQIHLNVVDMYLQDERFKNYYDQHGEGLAQILRDAVHNYL
jgi:DNA-binding transcriptional MerR regulator